MFASEVWAIGFFLGPVLVVMGLIILSVADDADGLARTIGQWIGALVALSGIASSSPPSGWRSSPRI